MAGLVLAANLGDKFGVGVGMVAPARPWICRRISRGVHCAESRPVGEQTFAANFLGGNMKGGSRESAKDFICCRLILRGQDPFVEFTVLFRQLHYPHSRVTFL